jgi:hypothetical protein
MFIRGRERASEVWHRFHFEVEGFEVSDRDGRFEARIVANATWAVDLFLALSERLSPRVGTSLADVRTGRRWSSPGMLLPQAREGILMLRSALAAHAGVEWALFDDDDQITLSPHLEVFVYARTERWFYMLRDLGLRRYRFLSPRSWRLARDQFPSAPALTGLITDVVARLGLDEE